MTRWERDRLTMVLADGVLCLPDDPALSCILDIWFDHKKVFSVAWFPEKPWLPPTIACFKRGPWLIDLGFSEV